MCVSFFRFLSQRNWFRSFRASPPQSVPTSSSAPAAPKLKFTAILQTERSQLSPIETLSISLFPHIQNIFILSLSFCRQWLVKMKKTASSGVRHETWVPGFYVTDYRRIGEKQHNYESSTPSECIICSSFNIRGLWWPLITANVVNVYLYLYYKHKNILTPSQCVDH